MPTLASIASSLRSTLDTEVGTDLLAYEPELQMPDGASLGWVVAVKDLTLLTSGTPADIGSIIIPDWVNRHGLGGGNAVYKGYMMLITETGSGLSGTIAIRDDAAGAGIQLSLTATVPATPLATSTAGINSVVAFPYSVSQTLYVHQTVASGAAGTVSAYIYLFPTLADTTTPAAPSIPASTPAPGGGTVGALYTEIQSSIDDLLGERPPAQGIPIFSVQDHVTPAYTRNTDCWAASLVEQLTCLSPWNSRGGNTRAGILISPRHVLCAAHYPLAAADTIRFVKSDNTLVTRTVDDVADVAASDFQICLLDSDVGAGIEFARYIPDSFADKMPASVDIWLPAASTDQNEHLHVRSFYPYPTTDTGFYYYSSATGDAAADAVRQPYYSNLVGGDSGSPMFVFIDGKLCIQTVITKGLGGGGYSLTSFASAVNAAMTSLGGGYTLTPIDLSGYADL